MRNASRTLFCHSTLEVSPKMLQNESQGRGRAGGKNRGILSKSFNPWSCKRPHHLNTPNPAVPTITLVVESASSWLTSVPTLIFFLSN
jgi:hypothetical protein